MAGLLKLSESDVSPGSWLSRDPRRKGKSQGVQAPGAVTCASMTCTPTPVLCLRCDDPAAWGLGVPISFPQADWEEQGE